MKDIAILVADLDTENVLMGLLPRIERVYGTRPFTFDIKRHLERDPGCAKGSAEFLRPFSGQFHYALVVFDLDGSGQEAKPREEIEMRIEKDLVKNGWAPENVLAIVIDPEVENWMWINTPRVSEALNWKDQEPLFDWLTKEGWLKENEDKPEDPKASMEAVLKKTKKARSASIYNKIAGTASFKSCKDPAFNKLIEKLKEWFLPPV